MRNYILSPQTDRTPLLKMDIFHVRSNYNFVAKYAVHLLFGMEKGIRTRCTNVNLFLFESSIEL
jgi:hypothetical protein